MRRVLSGPGLPRFVQQHRVRLPSGNVYLDAAAPELLVGIELDIIAAVVLGGASIFGGRGSVLGTVLGVLIVQVIHNSLILAGVPSAWQRTAVGLLLVVGVGVQALAARRAATTVHAHDEEGVPA